MRLNRSRASRNVEDRRASGPLGGGTRIGIGTIVLALVAWYFGIDPSAILGLSGDTTGPAPAGQPIAADDAQGQTIARILGETEDVWGELFREQTNGQYRDPTLVLYRGATPTACGTGQSAMGPFYCPGDEKLYIDLAFFDELSSRMGVKGDFAPAYVIAHEVGHHVQKQLGAMQQISQIQRSGSQRQSNQASVRLELQADCYAGVWAHHADAQHAILEPGDIQAALDAAQAVGDDTLQKQSQGYVVPDSFTHGSARQRMGWFLQGYDKGTLRSCDTFAMPDPQ